MFASFKNFLALNEIALPLLGFKIKLERKVKPLFTWEDAERTISKATIEYQPIYRLMLWSALDIERFVQLNRDTERLADIKHQIADERRDWIRIDVPKGRKSSPPFYSLVPRDIAKLLPVLDQQSKPITNKNSLHYHWGNALKRAGFQFKHFGPHNLRSAWTGEATRRKLEPVVREHQMGHIVDSENYQRMQQDERWVTEQFRKAWETQPLVTEDRMREIQEQQSDRVRQVEEQLDRVERAFAIQETLIDGVGGLPKLMELASKKGPYFKRGRDGRMEPTDALRRDVQRRRERLKKHP
jgi:hypothetical protein